MGNATKRENPAYKIAFESRKKPKKTKVLKHRKKKQLCVSHITRYVK